MISKFFKTFCLFMTGFLLMTSCGLKDEPEIMSKPLQQGTFEMGLNEGSIIRLGSSNLFTITADYPDIKVSSIFSTVTKPPKIKYMGEFDFINTIPLRIDESVLSDIAEIHDNGGYIVRLSSYDATGKASGDLFVRMLIKERIGATSKDSYLAVEYQIFSTKTNLVWKL